MSHDLGNGFEEHKPGSDVVYRIDWSREASGAPSATGMLEPGEIIASSSWSIEAGKQLTMHDADFGPQITEVWVTGAGVPRSRVTLTCTVVTNSTPPRTEKATITLLVTT